MAEADPNPYREPMHPVQIEGLRKMTPAQKIERILALRESPVALKRMGLRMRHRIGPRRKSNTRRAT